MDGRTLFELFPHVQFVDYTKNPALSVLAVVIVVRIAWLMVYRAIVATIRRWRPGLADRMASRDPRGAIVLGWSGMRGLITLATAFALPQQFPGRDLIVLCAFCVVLGTLVIQGFTLLPGHRLWRNCKRNPSKLLFPRRSARMQPVRCGRKARPWSRTRVRVLPQAPRR